MNLAICIFACGPNSTHENVLKLMNAFDDNIGIKHCCMSYHDDDTTFAQQFHAFINKYSDSDYFMYCHDDILLKSDNIFPKTMAAIKDRTDIGWITYSNNGYTSHGKRVSSSVRVSLHKDRGKYPHVFECHSNPPKYPERAVKVYGPMTHLNMISSEALQKIMPCPTFIETPILVDEDWCLQSNIAGLTNIWIPDIFYEHPIQETEANRTVDSLRNADTAHQVFKKKWGCRLPYDDNDIQLLTKKHPCLKEFTDRNSYDWIYLDN